MLAAKAAGPPSFALDATFYDEMLDRVHRTGVPALFHQMLSRRSINVVGDYEAAGFLKYDTPTMHKVSICALSKEDIARG